MEEEILKLQVAGVAAMTKCCEQTKASPESLKALQFSQSFTNVANGLATQGIVVGESSSAKKSGPSRSK